MISIKDNYKYAMACVTSMGVRITPFDRMPVGSDNLFRMQSTSAETNVLNVSSSLGEECLALTKFVKGSPIASYIKSELRKRGISYMGVEVEPDGPWGVRHQFNIADQGFGMRAPRVWNDRAGEVGRTITAEDFDLDKIFKDDGVAILHLSGLIAAMSPDTAMACLKVAHKAKENGTLISFDLNYRKSFWIGRETELSEVFNELASIADILIGNEEDYQKCLGITGPESLKDLDSQVDSFKTMIKLAKNKYQNVSIFATTLREVISANEHLWGAIMLYNDEWHYVKPKVIDIMDRIGGGDAFTGGLLYGVLKNYEPAEVLNFGWGCGVLVTGSLNDYAEPRDVKQIRDIYEGNARVQR